MRGMEVIFLCPRQGLFMSFTNRCGVLISILVWLWTRQTFGQLMELTMVNFDQL